MDVNTRIEQMDEELKLVKNEIKQVLLEIQEHVLNIQNPFTSVVGAGAGAGAAPAPAPAPAAADVAAVPEQVTPAPTPQAPEPQVPAFNQQPQGAGFGGFPGQQQGMAGPQGFPGQQNMGGVPDPGAGAPPPPPAAPPDTTAATPGTDRPEQDRRSETIERRRFDVGDDLLGDYDLGDIGDLGTNDEPDWTADEDENMVFSDSNVDQDDEDDFEYEDGEVEGDDYENEDKEPTPKRGKKAKKVKKVKKSVADKSDDERDDEPDDERDDEPDGEPDDQDTTISLDLVTLASLVQWTDRVVQRAGPEYLEALFEISEMTGRLSKNLKNTLLVLVKLLSIEVDGSSIGATETVRLLAQLDGLMGNTTKEDARLLPFILEGNNLEVLSLIQR